MSSIHKIRCSCGQFRAVLRASSPSNRCVCYCIDCQAFARHLKTRDVLDAQGGTDIIQVPSSNVMFTQGAENLACLRLTETGMLRWYSTCCQTPIGNTPANWKLSFVGLIHTCLSSENQSLEASFGPVTMRVGVKSAIGAEKPAARGLLSGIGKAVSILIRGRFGGAYRASPFFNPQTGIPIANPKVLSTAELATAKSAA
jgi:Family of unknown function (DUF6151)